MRKSILSIFAIFALTILSYGQSKVELSGTVIDKETDETVVGAKVVCDNVLFEANLSSYLESYDPKSDIIFCEIYGGPDGIASINGFKFRSLAGGGGIILSNSLMRKIYPLIDEFNIEWNNLSKNGQLHANCYGCGDIAMAYMTKKYFNLDLSHVDGMYSQPPHAYTNIVKKPISFHYISPHEMDEIYKKYK